MPRRFPRSSFHGGRIIDAYSLDSLPADDDQPNDPASVRFRSIAEILLRGIRRCVAEDRNLNAAPERTSNTDAPVLGNLGDFLDDPDVVNTALAQAAAHRVHPHQAVQVSRPALRVPLVRLARLAAAHR
jgi:hypothetical protein